MPLNNVRPRIPAASSATMVLNTYIATISSPCTGKPRNFVGANSAAISSVYTGSRAEQLISGRAIMVTMRSRRRSIVRVAMIAGTAQA